MWPSFSGHKPGCLMESSQVLQNEAVFQYELQNLIIDPLRAVYWIEQKMLIVSDLHLGKAGHFRKNGVPVPRQVHISDFQKLNSLIEKYTPESIIFLGDLFHSELNEEWQDFVFWSNHHREIRQILIEGNHDILHQKAYAATQIEILQQLTLPPFHLTHVPADSELYNLAGHIHPSVRLTGSARQGATFPCFYFAARSGLFPAFGNFTGNHRIKPKKGDRVFALTGHSVIDLMG